MVLCIGQQLVVILVVDLVIWWQVDVVVLVMIGCLVLVDRCDQQFMVEQELVFVCFGVGLWVFGVVLYQCVQQWGVGGCCIVCQFVYVWGYVYFQFEVVVVDVVVGFIELLWMFVCVV